MRRNIDDDLVRSFLTVNALLREEVKAIRRELQARRETKYNPNWSTQPRAPRGGADGGQWVGNGGAARSGDGALIRISGDPGDPMDGADAAMFGELALYESTRGRYSRALEHMQDPRARMRIAVDRATLARQVFGNFSHEEEENIYLEEMRTRRGRVALGGTDLSERALRHRRQDSAPVGDGRNVAVIEYRDAHGRLEYITRNSDNDAHAEELAARELRRLQIPADRVTRIYTDREPCSESCRDLLRQYSRARVTWAVDWPDDLAGRTTANNALRRQIRSYRRMESQDTLPIPLWRQPNPAGNNVRPSRRRRRRP